MRSGNQRKLQLPALRAHIGDWVYYATFMTFGQVSERLSMVSDIHKSEKLGDWIQRQVDQSEHSASIARYLLTQKQRFFNALVVGVYGGKPQWYELRLHQSQGQSVTVEDSLEGALGVLSLSGKERLFAIDGQHRVVGIKRALEEKDELRDEEICVLMIAHEKHKRGKERTRRLFSTLNRYAKPVSKMELIALDEDDIVAIITRRLVDDYPLLHRFISLKKGNSLPKSDKTSLSTVTALYDSLDALLRIGITSNWRDYKKSRPSEDEIERQFRMSISFWNLLLRTFSPLRVLRNSGPNSQVASRFRHDEGGHLLFRPIGLTLIFRVTKLLVDEGRSMAEVCRNLKAVEMDISAEPWRGLIWDPINKTMNTDSERQKVATQLLLYGLGGDLRSLRTDQQKLTKVYAGMLNRRPSEVSLPLWT